MEPTNDEEKFLAEAQAELEELMREVSNTDVRHGPQPRTLAQDIAWLTAERDAIRQDLCELDAMLEDLEWAAEEEPAEFDRYAVRWIAAAIKEREAVDLPFLLAAIAALERLRRDGDAAAAERTLGLRF